MNQREKILAAVVAGLVLLVIGYFALNWVNTSIAELQSNIDDLDLQLGQRNATIALGNEASTRLAEYQRRSLPRDPSFARSQYEEWLLATAVDLFGQDRVSVKLKEGRPRGDTYTPVSFTVTAEGNLEQFTRFLYRFYQRDYLHRIDQLTVVPIENTRDLRLSCDVEALMVFGADPRKPLGEEKSNRVQASVDDYLESILGRNLFGPPNNPPQLASLRTPTFEIGGSLNETITARDEDPLDSVTFRLDKCPAGMRLDAGRGEEPGGPFSARLSWRPDRVGRYDVVVAAIDDGYPNKESYLEFEVNVTEKREPPPQRPRDPEPPPPKPFDHSRYTVLTSVQEVGGEQYAWFYTRTKDETVKCREGEELKIGYFTALVRRIDIDALTVELEVEDEVLLLALGDKLDKPQSRTSLKVGSAKDSGSVAPLD